jgi:hypothetical protein
MVILMTPLASGCCACANGTNIKQPEMHISARRKATAWCERLFFTFPTTFFMIFLKYISFVFDLTCSAYPQTQSVSLCHK